MGSKELTDTPHWTGGEEDVESRTRRRLVGAEEAVGAAVEVVVEVAVEEAVETDEEIEAVKGALGHAGLSIG